MTTDRVITNEERQAVRRHLAGRIALEISRVMAEENVDEAILADRAGLEISHLRSILQADDMPSLSELAAIAEALGVRISLSLGTMTAHKRMSILHEGMKHEPFSEES